MLGLAILAALNIADDVSRRQQQSAPAASSTSGRSGWNVS